MILHQGFVYQMNIYFMNNKNFFNTLYNYIAKLYYLNLYKNFFNYIFKIYIHVNFVNFFKYK